MQAKTFKPPQDTRARSWRNAENSSIDHDLPVADVRAKNSQSNYYLFFYWSLYQGKHELFIWVSQSPQYMIRLFRILRVGVSCAYELRHTLLRAPA